MIRLHMKNASQETLDFERTERAYSMGMAYTETENYHYIIRYQRNGFVIARAKKEKWWQNRVYLTVNEYLGVTKIEFFEFDILVGEYTFKKYISMDKEGKFLGTEDVPPQED